MTLFCFPHSAGGASAYSSWVGRSPQVDVQPVQLPGREDLIALPPVDDMANLVDLLGREISAVAPARYALFGHSMGAAIAAELAVWFDRRGCPPQLLVVSSAPVPPMTEAARAGLPLPPDNDGELVAHLLSLGGTPAEVFADPELREIMLEVVRADMRLLRGHRPTFDRLPVPLLVLGAVHDEVITSGQLGAWHEHAGVRHHAHMLAGDHFYLREQVDTVLALITHELSRSFAPASARRTEP